MRILAKSTLRAFWERHLNAEAPLLAWYRETEKADWDSPAQVKARYRSASFVGENQVSALRADFSHPSHAWCSSNLALNAVLSARAVSWTFPHPRSLQCLVGYRDGDHNALA
jgi:hypothetical protein